MAKCTTWRGVVGCPKGSFTTEGHLFPCIWWCSSRTGLHPIWHILTVDDMGMRVRLCKLISMHLTHIHTLNSRGFQHLSVQQAHLQVQQNSWPQPPPLRGQSMYLQPPRFSIAMPHCSSRRSL